MDTMVKFIWLCVALGLCSIGENASHPGGPLRFVHEWSQLEFDYPTQKDRQAAINNGTFAAGKIAPIDVDVFQKTTFITTPRIQDGVPVTFGTVSNKKLNNNPIIKPFPSWSWQTNPTICKTNRLVSVYRTQIDECQRLWVLDSGQVGESIVCPPQIIAFDPRTGQLLHRFEIPENQYEANSTFVTVVADVRDPNGNCSNTFVYVADCIGAAIIVYDVSRRMSWKITDKSMDADPAYATFKVNGDAPSWLDGILGMALSPNRPGEDRKLFYHPLSGDKESYVYTSYLKNPTRSISSSPFHTYPSERYTQVAAEAIDKNGIMYFGLIGNVTFNCWNTRRPYNLQNFVQIAKNSTTLQFISGLKVIFYDNTVWGISTRFQKVIAGTLNPNETNFRIFTLIPKHLE